MDLEEALEQFDAVEANLRRLEKIWAEMLGLVPVGISFVEGTPEVQRYRELARAFAEMIKNLPAIGECRIRVVPVPLNEIAQMRFDASEIGEPDAWVATEETVQAPGREIDEYRFRLTRARRELVRDRLVELVTQTTAAIPPMLDRVTQDNAPIVDPGWEPLVAAISQVERLAGASVPRTGRWKELRRHIAWAQGQDLHDIAVHDWPSVMAEIQANLYSDLEPVPVSVENLQSLVASKPSGSVTMRLQWSQISSEDFERLLFNIVADATDYANPQWLMQANAPDRGRDVSVERFINDTLTGTKRERVIIQAKHWSSRSIGVNEVSTAANQAILWEPPNVDALIVATTGRFTADAVAWVERRNESRAHPVIEMWPDSHLELLLATRPHIAAAFNLR